jgi:hypothetical protein
MHYDATLREDVSDDHGIALRGRLEELYNLGPLLCRQRTRRGARRCLCREAATRIALHGLTRDAELASNTPARLWLDHHHLDALG